MKKSDFIDNCRELTEMQVLFALESDYSLISECPREILTEDFLCKLVDNHSSVFQHIPKELRSKSVCDTAFRNDVQLITRIPGEHISEAMMYKAVCFNGSLLRGDDQSRFLSDRVLKASIKADVANMLSIPKGLLTKDILIYCFSTHAFLSSYLECSVSVFVSAIKSVLSGEVGEFAGDKHRQEIERWKVIVKNIIFDDNFMRHFEDDAVPMLTSFAFIALGLDSPAGVEKYADNPVLLKFLIDYHGHDVLIQHTSPLLKKKVLESSLGM